MNYTPEQKAAIIDEIAGRLMDGESLRRICKSEGMPDKATVLRWLNAAEKSENPEEQSLATIIASARDLQGDALFDDMTDVIQDVRDGKLEPNAAKTMLWAMQWQASKLRPRRYGDRVDIGNADGQPFNITIAK